MADVASEAVMTGSRATLLDAFVLAARCCADQEARGDVRDGLIDMPLPFRAAEKLGLDAGVLATEALARLEGRAADLLATFADRDDRAEIGVMGWRERVGESGFSFAMGDG